MRRTSLDNAEANSPTGPTRKLADAATTNAPQELLAQMCADLRLLWTQAGGPPLRSLSALIRLGKSQVGNILTGRVRQPPDWRVVAGMVRSFTDFAQEHGRLGRLSLSTGVEEFWRPRYAVVEHAFAQAPHAPTAAPPTEAVVPRQLPGAIWAFAGRTAELAALTDLVGHVATIDGTPGVGKTTLAVYWAHQHAERFPDGQLYVNMRGFDPGGAALAPDEALRVFLDGLGVPPERVPETQPARAALYRSLLAGRRMLVVLDNARDADQVRPLLPGAPGCLAIVTSRTQLSSLVAAEGAHPLTLDLLSAGEARDLLERRLGPHRVAAEPEAVDRILASCARLPLALSFVAARAAARPGFALAELAEELRRARAGLDAFGAGDPHRDARAVFSWSYQLLSQAGAALFRRLALHPAADLGTGAAASLAGVPADEVRPALAELARTHLVEEPAPGRYRCHDLLRAYATELATELDPEPDRQAAVHRMLDHYLHTALGAVRLLEPYRHPIAVAPPLPGVTVDAHADRDAAWRWFVAELPALLAGVDRAAGTGFDAHAWQLAWTLMYPLDRQGRWQDWVDTQNTALGAAWRLADLAGQANAHRGLGRAYTRLGRFDEAESHLGLALDLFGRAGDRAGEANAHLSLGLVLDRQGRLREALAHDERALDLFRATGDRTWQANALNSIGWCHTQLGEHRLAVEYCEQALALHLGLGERTGQADTWDSLGHAHQHLGDHARAISCYRRALELYRQTGSRLTEAATLSHLGDALLAAGDRDEARATFRLALDMFDELGHPDGDRLRTKLAEFE